MQAKIHRSPILCIGGLDPSGGAGLQADIETIAACGGHALPIATCLTAQNTSTVDGISPVNPDFILNQADLLLKDFKISGCKIGVIPNTSIVTAIAEIISHLQGVPIVFDPVISASSGTRFTEVETIEAMKKYLFPHTSVVTPNHFEIAELTQRDRDIETQCEMLCDYGSEYVLLTGGDCLTPMVTNSLYSSEGLIREYTWQRLSNHYHGSGCTLSSAISTYLALGADIETAAEKAQLFTLHALEHAESLGTGQWIPNRLITKSD